MPSSPDSLYSQATIAAFRWLLVLAAIGTFGFWWMYQVVGPSPYDVLWLRAVMASPFLLILAGTYWSPWVRRHVWALALLGAVAMNGYFSTLALLSGFGQAWTIAVLTATSASILALAAYARETRQVWLAAAANLAALAVPLLVLHAEPLQVVLVMAYATLLATLITISGVAQVRTRHAYRQRRDEAAAQSRLLRAVVDAIPEHVYVKDREGRCLVRNRFSAEVMGMSDPEEAVGLTVFDTSDDPEVAAAYWEEEDRVMRTGEPDLDHEEPYAFEGSRGWISTSRIPLTDEAGAVVGLVGVTRDVTAEREAEETLRTSKEAAERREQEAEAQRLLLQTVIDTIPDHIYVKDLSGRATLRNVASAQALGYDDPGEAIGFCDTDSSADRTGFGRDALSDDLRVMQTGRPLRNKEERALDGGWLLTTKIPLRDVSGQTVGLVGVSRDVTMQRRAQEALREARDSAEHTRRLLRTVIDAIPDCITVKDREGRCLTRNLADARIIGYDTVEETVGLTLFDTAAPRDLAEAAHAEDCRVMETGEPMVDVESPRVFGTGWKESTKVPIRDEAGEVVGLVTIMRDITARKESEQALREAKEVAEASEREARQQREMLQSLFDAIPDAIFVVDAEERFVAVNRGTLEFLNEDVRGRVVGHTRAEVVPPEIAAEYSAYDRLAVESGGRVHRMENDYVTPEGRRVTLETTRVVVRDDDGGLAHIVGVARDVTERREAEAALREAKEAAEAATRAKSEFLANMSHEIRTPMNGVIGMTSLLLDTPLDREQRDFVETIRHSGDALLTIINDILDFSKIEAGMLSLELHPFEVRSCVEAALDLVAQPAAEKGVELAYLIEDGVPRTVTGDVTRVRQVLVNLLSNAVKFTHKGSICVRVDAAPPDAEAGAEVSLLFAVEDTGIGIPEDKLALVFDSFSQADASTTREYGGTGLGLTICRRLVDLMGGEMSVESAVGRGSTFRFAVTARVAPSERRVFLRSEQPVLEGRRVLVVDDNDVNREILTRLSTRWRMQPDEVVSGAAALDASAGALAESRPYDLVLLDMQMPGMDGLEVARTLSARPSPPVIVMLTSIHREGALRSEAREAGVYAVLYKPTKPSQLYDVLIEAFEGHAAARPVEGEAPQTEAVAWVARPREAPARALRVLVAEDNVVNQKVAVRLLSRLGYSADVVANGAEAVAAVERRARHGECYDVVFMDVQMPEMDGLAATRAIRASGSIGRQPYVIALTANAMQGDREACLQAGADDYLAKPVQLESLRDGIERAAQGRPSVAARV